jgi:hypothetical protein
MNSAACAIAAAGSIAIVAVMDDPESRFKRNAG